MSKEHVKDFVRTWIEIDKRSLFFNLRYFQKRARGVRMIAMIKSNAYGHGLVLVAKLLANLQPTTYHLQPSLWFGVDSITEALRLRKEKIKNPILVLGYTLPKRLPEAVRENIVITISHFEGLKMLSLLRKRPRFHLKIDTGMHRQGFQEYEVPRLIKELKRTHLIPDGIYSHLAMADNAVFSKKQIVAFERVLSQFKKEDLLPKVIHFNKTEGIHLLPQSHYTMVRLGIGLYGYYPSPGVHLKPILTWKTLVAEVKKIKKGEGISYDLTETVKKDSKIAILPIGYWHGFDRGLSSKGEVLIHGKRAKVLGRVTMDMIMVDVTKISGIRVGDEVVIIGKQKKNQITADEMGEKIGTTSYEVLTRINPLIRKIVV